MKAVRFLSLEQVLAIHADQVRRYGGGLGVRDLGLLKSALAMPQASFSGQYLHPTLHEMAAAYLFHLSQAHAFVDGNKRVALATALTFFDLNGHELIADPDRLYDLCMRVAAGEASKADASVFFAAHLHPLGG